MTNPITPELLVASPIDLAYAAGLFEGEGNVQRRSKTVTLAIHMCDAEPLDLMHRIVGGYRHGPFEKPNPKHKAYFTWNVHESSSICTTPASG